MSDTLLTEGGPEPTGAPQGIPEPAPSPAPAPAPSNGDDGRIFLSKFEGKEWAQDPSITRFADDDGAVDVETLAQSYTHAQSLVGKDKIVLPQSEDLESEDWQETFNKLGRPEQPDAYEFERPELPEGMDAVYSEDTESHFREVAHGIGLNKRQAAEAYKALISQRLEELGQHQIDSKTHKDEGIQAIRREQGDNFDNYMSSAKAAIREFSDADYVEYLEESGQGNDPRVIRQWANVGKQMRGDQRLEGNSAQPTPADVQSEIDAYIDKHGAAVDNYDHPDYQRHRQHLDKLYMRRYPDATE